MELEVDCERCDGTGYVQSGVQAGGRTTCNKCWGRAKFPTEAGEKLLDFIQKYLTTRLYDDDGYYDNDLSRR